jgi:hypothetical protein
MRLATLTRETRSLTREACFHNDPHRVGGGGLETIA